MMMVGMTMMRRGSRGVWSRRSLDFLSFGTELRRFERVAGGLQNGRRHSNLFVNEKFSFDGRSLHWSSD